MSVSGLVAGEGPSGRTRDLGLSPGVLSAGKWNAITDVGGVQVGHFTLIEGKGIRTGVTVILPHDGNPYRQRVPAAVHVGNGFGKAVGFTQISELGELETPIALTNTLAVYQAAHGVADWVLDLPGNEDVRSVNAVAGETNDGWLNDIRARVIEPDHVHRAIEAADSGPVREGNVGAGTGTRALGFKGGIGTASRVLPAGRGGYTVGVLVQSNFGGILTIDGVPVGERLDTHYMADEVPYERPDGPDGASSDEPAGYDPDADGSIMIVVATDAPLGSRNLERLARRAMLGVARTGGFSSNGSGDYVIAFSTHPDVRIETRESDVRGTRRLANPAMSPLFLAVVEAVEEAILNSLFAAETLSGHKGRSVPALPTDRVVPLLERGGVIDKPD
ncbi:S58 family peptidase [Wenzhouxiangella sp. 15181]|nr:S58 family peptidase [Wenzhouxiangella sp. 15181]RFP67204.1 S58 family peptidase [Wenzhouxiangella sp. 15190]